MNIDVKVLKFDKEKTRVSLGLKQLNEDPWFEISKAHPEGSKLKGKITNIADYGCFVEIHNGVEGLFMYQKWIGQIKMQIHEKLSK